MSDPFFRGSSRTTFLAVAHRCVPALGREHEERVLAIVEEELAPRPRSALRLLCLFLLFLRLAPLVRFGSRFERLSPERQDAVLRFFESAPLLAFRSGFWGVRTLAFLGWYGSPEVWPSVRYSPSFSGNERLHA